MMPLPTRIAEQLAAERRADLLAQADAHGAAAALRERRAPGVVLRRAVQRWPDQLIAVRPITVADGPALRREFEQLSARSRMQRFLSLKGQLSDAEVRYLTDVDHVSHEALVATMRVTHRPLGIARWIRDRDDPCAADIAMTIVDAWQGLGIGTGLAQHLVDSAVAAGIERFTADVLTDNAGARRLVRGLSPSVRLVGRDGPVVHYEVDLADGAVHVPAQREQVSLTALRSAACR
jgi:GNAT superfamily N-acetyltransferase